MVARVAGLVAVVSALQEAMAAFVASSGDSAAADGLFESVRAGAERATRICRRRGLEPADLPPPSRRAFGWLAYLAGGDALWAHLTALRTASAASARLGGPGAAGALRTDFFHTSTLWRVSPVPGRRLLLVASEAFVTAPEGVIDALVGLALRSVSPQCRRLAGRYRATVRDYASGETFRALLRVLEPWAPPATAASRAQGRQYDLREVFSRVNRVYFRGRLDPPGLVWSQAPTRRKLGHYQAGTDTVMLSLTLDSPDVPEFVVDFVMYHELLHKSLGVGMKNGRQRAHTSAFRKAERDYPRYEEAEASLRRLRGTAGRGRYGRVRAAGGRSEGVNARRR